MTTLAIDPGLRGVGAAYFVGPTLIYANYVSNPVQKGDGPTAWFALADAVFSDFKERGYRGDAYVVEIPQVYRVSKGDPNDLIEIAAVGAAVGSLFTLQSAVGYRPREWKSQTPKAVHHPRILGQLSETELGTLHEKRKAYAHNMVDAIGLGLYHLERTRARIPAWKGI